jgi:hypothetical protein
MDRALSCRCDSAVDACRAAADLIEELASMLDAAETKIAELKDQIEDLEREEA